MWKVLFRARRRFDKDQRGNVAIIFAFAMVPLIGLLGGAVDVARHQRHKVELLDAMDAGAIALVRRGATSDADANTFVNNYINVMLAAQRRDPMLHVDRFVATKIAGGYRVSADGEMDTAFLPVVGIRQMPLKLETEVVNDGGNFEVALALDNTGSMAQNGKIGALREAANTLVDTLYSQPGSDKRVKMALVPFVTAVNIRGAAFDPSWIDRTGTALGSHATDDFSQAVDRMTIFAALGNGQLGSDGLPTSWKGCVEARAEHDLDDTDPATDVATHWTPYLWPDDSDVRGPGPYLYDNSYLVDQMSGNDAIARMRNINKYFTPIRLASFNDNSGPNKSCAGPIVELNNDTQRMHDAINAMAPHPGSGTNIAQGLVWGWRVLSPGEPFTQGVSYDDTTTQKALVLLSDGWNEIGGDYTSYGHLADGRLGNSEPAAIAQMNKNITTVCQAVKAKNIRLYMILLQVNDPTTQKIFQDCASVNENGETLYYYAPNNDALQAAFADIGQDLTNIRISR